jgi:hypothetical protein
MAFLATNLTSALSEPNLPGSLLEPVIIGLSMRKTPHVEVRNAVIHRGGARLRNSTKYGKEIFTDHVTEDDEKYHIGGVTEYLSRFNLVTEVLDTETGLDLIAVVEAALREITDAGHELGAQVILVTDNGPAMKSRRFRKLCEEEQVIDPGAVTEVSSANHRA